MKYPFDVNKAILWLGDLADLIFVFFDPIGQALCKRTLNIVEKLSEKQADRMRFYLTKADESGHENDRQRVMMQIVQELCKRPGLNRTGFDMPTIFVPSLCARTNRCVNQIEEVCKDIEKTINLTVQNTLNTLEKDCHDIASMIENKLVDDINSRKYNRKAIFHQIILVLFSFALPMFLLLMSNLSEPLFSLAGSSLKETLISYTIPLRTFWNIFTEDFRFYISIGTIVLSLLFLITAKFSFRKRTCLSRKQKYVLQEYQDFVKSSVKKKVSCSASRRHLSFSCSRLHIFLPFFFFYLKIYSLQTLSLLYLLSSIYLLTQTGKRLCVMHSSGHSLIMIYIQIGLI
ncbi:Hypothetical predicted protein [Octopus vulgaris]|uniref:Uncharacterized protein n=1 Tax=Octopus vulgaris TaxID=6645 RepID=A0AA36FPE9_OCTVU|nr:Hypothetical predicted protein [Octopus vulgaris]